MENKMDNDVNSIIKKIRELRQIVHDYKDQKFANEEKESLKSSPKKTSKGSQKPKTAARPPKRQNEKTPKNEKSKSQQKHQKQQKEKQNIKGIEIPPHLCEKCQFLYASGKRLRYIRNNHLLQFYLDAWLTELIRKLGQKNEQQKKDKKPNQNSTQIFLDGSSDLQSQSFAQSTADALITDELINDPEVKDIEEMQRSLLEDDENSEFPSQL